MKSWLLAGISAMSVCGVPVSQAVEIEIEGIGTLVTPIR